MGMYDTIHIPCPKCQTPVDIQSKGGECLLNNYTLDTAPVDVLLGLMDRGYIDQCDKCKAYLKPVVEVQRPVVWLEQVAPPKRQT
jgi:hypothetical protein